MQEPAFDVFQRVSTQAMRDRDRFDYWRALHDGVALDLFERGAAPGFKASLLFCTGGDGVKLGHAASSGTLARFDENGRDVVLLSATTRDAVNVTDGGGDTTIVGPALGLSLFDCRRRAAVRTAGRHAHLYLSLPRRMVIEAMGCDPVPGRDAIRRLPASGLSPFLHSHMRMLASRGPGLDRAEATAAMRMATALALAVLRQQSGDRLDDDEPASHEALFAAARHLIELRHGDPTLTAGSLAATLGCSRAHLYRVFAAHDATIGQVLRDVRLDKARALLSAHIARNIAAVAHECGYGDISSFGRAFRDRFGVSPAAWREQTRTH
jgi:AraC-like DNA-binding protein